MLLLLLLWHWDPLARFAKAPQEIINVLRLSFCIFLPP